MNSARLQGGDKKKAANLADFTAVRHMRKGGENPMMFFLRRDNKTTQQELTLDSPASLVTIQTEVAESQTVIGPFSTRSGAATAGKRGDSICHLTYDSRV